MTTNITVDGKQYTVSEATTYTMEPGKLYKDEYGHFAKLSAENVTYTSPTYQVSYKAGHVVFPLRELIPVEKDDKIIDLQAQLDAMTKRAESAEQERDALVGALTYLIAGVENSEASLLYQEVRKLEGIDPDTSFSQEYTYLENALIAAKDVLGPVREVPKP